MPDGNSALGAQAKAAGITIHMPTLHAGQERAFNLDGRFKAIRAGRRWGKSSLASVLASDAAINGQIVGFFAPDYKRLSEIYRDIKAILAPLIAKYSDDGAVIRLTTGGRIDFWTLEDDSAGRSRKYHLVLIDEAAFTKPNMVDIWERAIKPTLFDYSGQCYALSNTNGIDETNFFWRVCNIPKYGFAQYHAPTHDNPLLPMRMAGETDEGWLARRKVELAALQTDNPPLVYQQEYRALFVDFSGDDFFDKTKLLLDPLPGTTEGVGCEWPQLCTGVFAVIDTAVKTGKEHDGTAVKYFAVDKNFHGFPLVVLDWDYVQIEGAVLEKWMPEIVERLKFFADTCRPLQGNLGIWIEDKQSGTILLQQAANNDWNAHAIDSKLTAMGKSERAINVSGHVHRGEVKYSRHAAEKVTTFKGITRNHSMVQVSKFRIGDEDRNKADDLLDTFCYGIALGLGNNEGF